jgi:alpha-beta hydrolase superfamily lysophospholipase
VIARAVVALAALTVVTAVFAPAAVPVAAPASTVSYSGTIRFRSAESSGVTLALTRRTVTVTLAPGHVAQAGVLVKRRNGTLRFAVAGLPKPIVFALKAKGTKLNGTASQGAVRAAVTLTRGRRSIDTTLGYFTSPNVEVARFTRHGFSTKPFAIDLATGAFGPPPAQVGTRLDVHQFEVRFPSGKAMLAGTLTVPPGTGPHPAVVYVSGSGDTLREESHWLDGLFVSRGIAVLAYDKRGIGQSGGIYTGDLASNETITTLAGDAAAAARFLAAQQGIDKAHIGFYGISQGGWIIPQAAVRAKDVVSWTLIESGPTVTQGESDNYASLTGNLSLAEAEKQAHALGPSGYDPVPWIRRLAIPVLWLCGGQDRNQPTGTSMEILRKPSAGHDFTSALFASAPHSLFDERGFPPDLFVTAAGWLRQHGLL